MKRCSRCKTSKPKGDFYKRQSKDRRGECVAYCKTCHRKYLTIRQNNLKIEMIKMKGAACKKCGETVHPILFDFHHREPNAKEYAWNQLRRFSRKRIIKELEKCDLLCSNCHRMELMVREYWPDENWYN